MDLARLSDDDLLVRTPGCPEAFGEFYARHEAAVLGFMLRRTGQPEVAADLAAETFAAALVSVRRFRPGPAPAAAWLYGIARHVLLRDGQGEIFAAAVSDGIGELVLTFADDSTERLAVHDNAAHARLERPPVRVDWRDARGRTHSEELPPGGRSVIQRLVISRSLAG